MEVNGFLLEPIQETNQYLITRRKEGSITNVGVRTVDDLIENWAKTRPADGEVIAQRLREGATIKLFD